MKAILYTLITLSLITSCKSIDKMLERGEYDKAFDFALDKLAGEKHKETKYVKGLEKAYRTMNARDLDKIEDLKYTGRTSKWEEIYDIYTKIEKRERSLYPLLPLVSKDGYEASFEHFDFDDEKNKAITEASEFYYHEGLKYMEAYEATLEKNKAREAYFYFAKTKRFFHNYKDTENWMNRAERAGTTFISIDITSEVSDHSLSAILRDKMAEMRLTELDSRWEKYFFFDKEKHFDKFIVIDIKDLHIDNEKEINNNYTFSEVIEEGFENLYDKNGKLVVDSLGKAILVPRKVTVKAWVSEIFREKNASAMVNVMIYDAAKTKPKANIPVSAYHNFNDSAMRYTGDRRAIDSKLKGRLDDHIADFPTAFEMANDLSNHLLVNVEEVIRDYNF